MKRILLSLALLPFLLPAGLQAQITIGAHGGLHSNKVRISGLAEEWTPRNHYVHSYNLGLFVDIPMLNNFSFQPGLNLVEKGFLVRATTDFNFADIPIPAGVEATTRLTYLEMPLLIRYSYGEGIVKLYGFAGPHFSYATNGRVNLRAIAIVPINLYNYDLDLSDDLYNRFEVGGLAGIGVAFKTGPLNTFIQGSYQHGFTNMLDDPIIDIRLRNYGYNLTGGIQYTF